MRDLVDSVAAKRLLLPRIAPRAGGTFEPDPAGGIVAFLTGPWRYHELVDWVANDPDRPRLWWIRSLSLLGRRAAYGSPIGLARALLKQPAGVEG